MKHNIQSSLFAISAIYILLLASCQSDMDGTSFNGAKVPIEFGLSIQGTSEVNTRTEGLDSSYIASEPYSMDFYIQLNCENAEDKTNHPYSELQTYVIPSGYEGRLEFKHEADDSEENKPLFWHDLTSQHTFYAWTIPWDKNWTPEYDNGNLKPVKVEFHNSSEEDVIKKGDGLSYYSETANNAILENFIGAKSTPCNYKENGKYVDLTFHHLVSKIKIASFVLIESTGAVQKDLLAEFTFVGMPTAATFYPHPENGKPYVGEPYIKSDDDGITYFIINNRTEQDYFYVCPEVDFSQIDYKVKIKNEEYKNYDTYYGTFGDVLFERRTENEEWAYDKGDGSDKKILHAGEMMTLNITLIPGVGPGMKIVIDPWSTEAYHNAEYHTHSGVYSEADVKTLLDAFLGQKNNGTGTTKEDLERLYEMYGQEKTIGDDPTPKKTFPLYDNVEIGESIFPVDKDYIIDGMGHTITLKTNGGTYGWAAYYNIGPMIDVYLTDPNGNNTIYIDAEGYVCLLNPETNEYERTKNGDNYNRLEPLDGSYKGYDINPVTGEVKKTTFYNWNITS